MKHLYGNWRKKYPGAELKLALWTAARVSTQQEWKVAMDNLKAMNEAAWQDMMSIPPKMWSRAWYSTNTCCDLQVNNMCEAFNRAILEYRDKPIISLLEGLKFYMNNRIVRQRDLMLRWKTGLCPMIQQKLEDSKRYSDRWTAVWNGNGDVTVFEVVRENEKYSCNLDNMTCACRRWELSGIPCAHVVACMWFAKRAPEGFVDAAYR